MPMPEIDPVMRRVQLKWGMKAAKHGLVIVAANDSTLAVVDPMFPDDTLYLSTYLLAYHRAPDAVFEHSARRLSHRDLSGIRT